MAEQKAQATTGDEHIARARETLARRRDAEAERLAEARVLYSDDAGLVLRPSFAIYLDALGTKQRVGELNNESLREQIRRLDRFRWFLHDDEWEGSTQRFLSFSDNVVLGAPIDDEPTGAYGLAYLVDSVAGYQVNMAANGDFLRGGISVGELYIDDKTAMGQALVDAVLLEEKEAVYPRVLLSDDCLGMVLAELQADEELTRQEVAESPWNEQILMDADGLAFVNYLLMVDDSGLENRGPVITHGLVTHRDAIVAALHKYADNPRVRAKYVWVAHYHNYVCDEFFPWIDEDTRVEEALTDVEQQYPRLFRRLVPPE